MLFSKILLLVALVISVVAVNGVPDLCATSADCSNTQYCSSGYCVSCRSNTDCALNEFCSTNVFDLSQFGSCKKFDKDGDDCVAYNPTEMTNLLTSNSTKCAYTYFNYRYNNYPAGSLSIDYQGTCVNGKCRMCNYASGAYQSGEGKNSPRTCVFPGKFATVHSQSWASGKYFEDPTQVWLAILFCLIVLILTFHIIGFLKK
ncbi:hypothetical protein RB653_007254 [Dictyostelium firmibasis]|uniref:Uncharacterized protein n=1 Tax=Dictyostelium firmibasis TaxID=79012 RepID=A0AAN7TNB9_9MYCE